MEECLSGAGLEGLTRRPSRCKQGVGGEVFAWGVCNPWLAPTVGSVRKEGDHFLLNVASGVAVNDAAARNLRPILL